MNKQEEAHNTSAMGLDGGTIPSRADILRRSSWRLANTSTSKSSRGGMAVVSVFFSHYIPHVYILFVVPPHLLLVVICNLFLDVVLYLSVLLTPRCLYDIYVLTS